MQNNPSLVFAGMNLGVISLATVVGCIFFKERINGLNAAGIVLAVAAIWFLFYGSMLHGWIPGFYFCTNVKKQTRIILVCFLFSL